MSGMAAKKQGYDFEHSLQQLEQLVERMESGELSLEDSLKAFEQGIKLTRECQGMLSKAEQKVEQLVKRNAELRAEPFDTDD